MDNDSLATLADEEFCYLTTTGRVTGLPHQIEIWFDAAGSSVYMLAGGRDRSDWVRNIAINPAVTVRIGSQTFAGQARAVEPGSDEDAMARELLVDKYSPSYSRDLTEWGRTALPVAIDLESLV